MADAKVREVDAYARLFGESYDEGRNYGLDEIGAARAEMSGLEEKLLGQIGRDRFDAFEDKVVEDPSGAMRDLYESGATASELNTAQSLASVFQRILGGSDRYDEETRSLAEAREAEARVFVNPDMNSVTEVRLSGGGRVYLIGGRLVMDGDGGIDVSATLGESTTGGMAVVLDPATGEKRQISIDDVVSVDSSLPADTYLSNVSAAVYEERSAAYDAMIRSAIGVTSERGASSVDGQAGSVSSDVEGSSENGVEGSGTGSVSGSGIEIGRKFMDSDGNVFTYEGMEDDGLERFVHDDSGESLFLRPDLVGNSSVGLVPVDETGDGVTGSPEASGDVRDVVDGVAPEVSDNVSQEVVPEDQESVPNPSETSAIALDSTPLQRIPRDEGGNPMFEQADSPETAWDALVEFSDGDSATAMEIAGTMVEEKRKALEKAQKLKIKGRTPSEMLASKKANAAELEKARVEYEYWEKIAGVEAGRQAADEQRIADAEEEAQRLEEQRIEDAMEITGDLDAVDVVALALGGGSARNAYRITPESLNRELGSHTKQDRRGLPVGIMATKENGGISIDDLAALLKSEDADHLFSGMEESDIRDLIIDAIRNGHMGKKWVVERHRRMADELAEQQRRHEEDLRDAEYEAAYHMSYDDFLSYEEEMAQKFENGYGDFDINEYNSILADEYERRKHEYEQDTQREIPRDGRGGEVLHGQGSHETGGGTIGPVGESRGEVTDGSTLHGPAGDVAGSSSQSVTDNQKEQSDGRAGEAVEPNNDHRMETTAYNGGRLVENETEQRAVSRGDIRVYEEGLGAARREHSDDSPRNRRESESERLVGIAKENGEFIPLKETKNFGEKVSGKTGESEVYINKSTGKVYKVKDPYAKSAIKNNDPEDAILEHEVHNLLFPETAYTFEGISEDLGDVRIVLSQEYVDSEGRPTQSQIADALAAKGLFPDGKYSFGNDLVSVTDVEGDNVLLGEDGTLYFIDPIIRFKKPAMDVIDALRNRQNAGDINVGSETQVQEPDTGTVSETSSGASAALSALERSGLGESDVAEELRRMQGDEEQKSEETSEENRVLFQRGDETLINDSEARQLATDAVFGALESAGIDVEMATPEMVEEVLGREDARLSAKQKRALETVSVQNSDEHQQTVISSANGAKILENLDTLAKEYEKNSQNNEKTFIGEVAKALGMKDKGKSSQYATFETKNGKIVTIRLSNHSATVSNFDNRGESDGISIVVSPKKSAGMRNDGEAHVVEYYYDSIKLRRAEGKPLAEIVRSLQQALYSGEFKDNTGLAERQEVNVGSETGRPRFSYFSKEAYARKREWAANRMASNAEIGQRNGLSEEQTDLLEELASLRHELHTSQDSYIHGNSDILRNLVKLNVRLHELGIEMPFIPVNEDDYIDIDTIPELYEVEDVPEDDAARQDWFDKNYDRIYDELEELNKKIEDYLGSIDEKYGTSYRPTGRTRVFMQTPRGKVYGWTVGGKIYLTDSGLNPNTPVHEYTHLWSEAMRIRNPKGWSSVKDLLRGTPVWDEVLGDENYSSIRDNDDEVASEALSRLSGRENAKKLEREAERILDSGAGMTDKVKSLALLGRMREALKRFWRWAGKNLFGIEKFGSIEEVTDRVLYDLVSGTDLRTGESASNIETVNERFNEQLTGLSEENADTVTFDLGRPSATLRSAGVEDKPMKLYGNKVIKKMKKHGFGLEELRDLPRAVSDPIAVFNNYGKDGSRAILTELRTEKGNFLVTLDLGKGKDDVDFNIISSVFGKGQGNIIDWFNTGKATYINKKKALDYLHHSALSAVTLDNEELSRAANVIENFENPVIEGEKNVKDDESEEETIVRRAKEDGSYMKAPNGAPTRLNERQWVQVRTKSFKDWFGDWENDPEHSSKVIDENGEPLVVYHGTLSGFTVFDHSKSIRDGFYFSNSIEFSRKFSGMNGHVLECFLNMRDPDRNGFDGSGAEMSRPEPWSPRDGGIFTKRNSDRYAEKGTREFIVFNPNQIKSATDNIGTFSDSSNDIRFSIVSEAVSSLMSDLEGVVDDAEKLNVVRRRMADFIGKHLTSEAGKEMYKSEIMRLIRQVSNARSVADAEMYLRRLKTVMNGAELRELSRSLEKLTHQRMTTKTDKGVRRGRLVDDRTRGLIEGIRETLGDLMATGVDEDIRGIRKELKGLKPAEGMSADDLAALESRRASLTIELRDLEKRRDDLRRVNLEETEEAVSDAISELEDEFSERGYLGESKQARYERLLMKRRYLEVRDRLSGLSETEASQKQAAGELTALRSQLREDRGRGDVDAVSKTLADISRVQGLQEQLEYEYLLRQEEAIEMTRELRDMLKDLYDTGRSSFLERQRRRGERRLEIVRMGIRAADTGKPDRGINARGSFWERFFMSNKLGHFLYSGYRTVLFSPLESFDYMLQSIDVNHSSGTGDLYAHFMHGERGAIASNDRYLDGLRSYNESVEGKIREIFGVRGGLEGFLRKSNDASDMLVLDVSDDRGHVKETPMTRGQATFTVERIWNVNKNPIT